MSSDKYIHENVENKIYSYWEEKNLFKPKSNKKQFSIVIPPPNVTGSLHMGHALNNSIQDLLTRYHRMNNFETLWQPGTDHAGIATQALVEKKLTSEKIDINEIGREKFIEKVWEWKDQYGDIIINQLKKLGCSCDWSRNAFTMDENLSKSVIKVFVDLYNKGLIYKDKKFDFKIKSPPASFYIKEAVKLKGGSKEPGRNIVASISKKQLESIAKDKMNDLNAHDIEEAIKIIAGSARSMGIEVKE